MKLIIGLGNPDKRYNNTYHNIGFSFIDKFAETLKIKVKKKDCKSLIGEKIVKTKDDRFKLILVKPQNYMNLSGEAVVSLKNKYKVDFDDIYVICDDIDLPQGTYRFREKGGAGTHNGLRNIVQLLGSTEFKRIRIGIGKNENLDLSDYVLSKISKEDNHKITDAINSAIEYLVKELKLF